MEGGHFWRSGKEEQKEFNGKRSREDNQWLAVSIDAAVPPVSRLKAEKRRPVEKLGYSLCVARLLESPLF